MYYSVTRRRPHRAIENNEIIRYTAGELASCIFYAEKLKHRLKWHFLRYTTIPDYHIQRITRNFAVLSDFFILLWNYTTLILKSI